MKNLAIVRISFTVHLKDTDYFILSTSSSITCTSYSLEVNSRSLSNCQEILGKLQKSAQPHLLVACT